MKNGKMIGAVLLVLAAVALCVWSALHKPKGMDISCPPEIQKQLEQVVQEMSTSGRNHFWNLSEDYWVKQPTKKEVRRYFVDCGLVYGRPKKMIFTPLNAVRTSEDLSAMKLNGSFISGRTVAVYFEKVGDKYKIKDFRRQ